MNLKKIAAVLSAAAVAVSSLAVSAFAAPTTVAVKFDDNGNVLDENGDATAETSYTVADVKIKANDTVTLTIVQIDSEGQDMAVSVNSVAGTIADNSATSVAIKVETVTDEENGDAFVLTGTNVKITAYEITPDEGGETTTAATTAPEGGETTTAATTAPQGGEEATTTPAAEAPSNNPGWVAATPSGDSSSSAAATTEAPAEVVTAANGESVEAPKDVIPEGAALDVKEQSKEDAVKAVEAVKATDDNKAVVETIKKAVEDGKAAVLEINLVKDGAEVQPNGTVKVTVDVPAALKDAAKVFVYRVEDDGTFTDTGAELKDGKVIFSTKHFSTYIFTAEALEGSAVNSAEEANKTDKNQNTGVAFILVPAVLAAAGVVASKKRK